jgi:hypothetical protein
MKKNIIGIDPPVSTKGFTIIPVWKISSSYSFAAGIYISSSKQTIAAVIITTETEKVFRINGEEITLDQFMQEFPVLKESVEKAKKMSSATSLPK